MGRKKRDCIQVLDVKPSFCIPPGFPCDPCDNPVGCFNECCDEPSGLNDDCTGRTRCCKERPCGKCSQCSGSGHHGGSGGGSSGHGSGGGSHGSGGHSWRPDRCSGKPDCGCGCGGKIWSSSRSITECHTPPRGCGSGSCWNNCNGSSCGCDCHSGTSVYPPKPCHSCKQTPCQSGCNHSGGSHHNSNRSRSSCPISESYNVTIVSKVGVRDEHRVTMTETVFAVDGYAKGAIHVKRGHTYSFTINQDPTTEGYEHMLFFTDDFLGGPAGYAAIPDTWSPSKLPGSPDPVGSGTVLLTISHDWPKLFYYQDSQNPACGGMIWIHDH